jgi:predicted ATPase/DNA-binding SARP family transcriptional activator
MDTQWHIALFGELHLQLGERVITRFRTQKSAALLAYLACHPRQAHSREVLMTILWPDHDPRASRNNLSVALNSLRRQLEPPGIPEGAVLIANRFQVQLNPEAFTTDVAAFEAALRAAERADSEEGRAQSLMEAVALYQGELLPGFYEEWILPEQQRLATLCLQALHELAAHFREAGDLERAIEYARRAVQADPLMEACHAELMGLYAQSGQVSLALRQYRELEGILKQEYDSEPSEATQALIRAIQSQELTQQADRLARTRHRTASAPAGREAERPQRQEPGLPTASDTARAARSLPLSLTRFFGREDEIERLQLLLRIVAQGSYDKDGLAPPARLVSLTGPGGSGKTRLVTEAARRWVQLLRCLVWFVPLADIADAALIPNAVADALGLPRLPQLTPEEQVIEALNRQPALLILDNFEHLLEDDAGRQFVGRLLSGVPRLRCLVTSRHRLELAGEQEFPIAPLSTPEAGMGVRGSRLGESPLPSPQAPPSPPGVGASPALLLTYASVQLFVDRAQVARPDFQVTTRNAPHVAALCARLEGLPLAIELAAARSQALTPYQMLSQVSRRFDFLVSRHRDQEARHATLRAVVDWSYRLLSSELQRFFRQLSVFRGGWTLEAAGAVSGEALTLDWLEELRDGSLLVTEETGSGMRFRMLETMREYASEQMSVEEASGLARRHAEYYTALAEEAAANIESPEAAAWYDQLEREHDNLRAALHFSMEAKGESVEAGATQASFPHSSADACEVALRLTVALMHFWTVRGHVSEGRRWFAAALSLPGAQARTTARADALNGAGELASAQSDYTQARAFYTECLAIRREIGDREGIANVLTNLGRVANDQVDYVSARALHAECLAILREIGDRKGTAFSLVRLGLVALEQGDYVSARALCEESLSIRREIGDQQGIAYSLNNLGDVAYRQGDYAEAQALYEQSLALLRGIGHWRGIASSLSRLGNAVREQGDYSSARALYEECQAILREIGARRGIASSLGQLGLVALKQGDYVSARALYEERLSISRESGDRRGIAEAIEAFAALTVRQPVKATRLLGATEALREIIGIPLSPNQRVAYDRTVATLRAALDEAAFAEAWQAGRAMTMEQAIGNALQPGEDTTEPAYRSLPNEGAALRREPI